MMTAEEYRRAQRSSLHLHRQFVMPNGKRYFYDFYQISFGPLPLTPVSSLAKGRPPPSTRTAACSKSAHLGGHARMAEAR